MGMRGEEGGYQERRKILVFQFPYPTPKIHEVGSSDSLSPPPLSSTFHWKIICLVFIAG